MLAIGGWIAGVLYPIGGFWLAIPGFIAGVLLMPGISIAHERYRKWIYCGDDFMPPCSCGSTEFKVEVVGDNDFHEVCQSCHKHYDRCRDKVYVIEDETRQPFKHLVKHRGWVEMEQEQLSEHQP